MFMTPSRHWESENQKLKLNLGSLKKLVLLGRSAVKQRINGKKINSKSYMKY